MFYGQSRWFVIAGLCGSALLACGSDSPDADGGTAGQPGGGSAGQQTGGSASGAGTSSTAGSSGTTSTAGKPAGGSSGTAGSSGGGSGGATSGAGGGGAGGAASGAGGGGAGGGAALPTAVANITGVNGKTVTGTATFTQGATMTTLVLDLTACPAGEHSSHLHATKDCGMEGMAAGGHWPNGEGLGNYTCADNKGKLTFSKPIDKWTVGDGANTDVSKYSFMVHAMGDPAPGDRIGCGVVDKK